MSGLDVGSGPPITTGLPLAWQRSMRRSVSFCCGSIPPVMTMSAQSMSSVLSSSAFRLTSLTFHSGGRSAARVIIPSGGAGHFAPQMSHAGCMLQKELGLKRGKTIKTFGAVIVTSSQGEPIIEGAGLGKLGLWLLNPRSQCMTPRFYSANSRLEGSSQRRAKKLRLAR